MKRVACYVALLALVSSLNACNNGSDTGGTAEKTPAAVSDSAASNTEPAAPAQGESPMPDRRPQGGGRHGQT